MDGRELEEVQRGVAIGKTTVQKCSSFSVASQNATTIHTCGISPLHTTMPADQCCDVKRAGHSCVLTLVSVVFRLVCLLIAECPPSSSPPLPPTLSKLEPVSSCAVFRHCPSQTPHTSLSECTALPAARMTDTSRLWSLHSRSTQLEFPSPYWRLTEAFRGFSSSVRRRKNLMGPSMYVQYFLRGKQTKNNLDSLLRNDGYESPIAGTQCSATLTMDNTSGTTI